MTRVYILIIFGPNTNTFNMQELLAVTKSFKIAGEVDTILPYGNGNINDTFYIKTKEQLSPNYILQKINKKVFSNIEELTHNKVLVSKWLSKKNKKIKGEWNQRFVEAEDGKYYYLDKEGNGWNLSEFIPNSTTHMVVSDEKLAYEGGKAIGIFHQQLGDMDPDVLYETLPSFHKLDQRIEQFEKAIAGDTAKRLVIVEEEARWLLEQKEDFLQLNSAISKKEIPERICHNDTKISNTLFTPEGKAICMIDLDTVMKGSILYDFGDAIRSGANKAAEDEADLKKVGMNMKFFHAYARGYLENSLAFITNEEIEQLAFSALFITYEQVIRFMTDFLEGDRYYKIRYPDHNLVRSRSQLKLLIAMQKNYEKMDTMVHEIAEELKTIKV